MIFDYRAYIYDKFRLLGKLNFYRLVNYIGIHISFNLSRILKKPLLWSSPFALNFETSSVCNLRCPECMTGMNKTIRQRKLIDSSLLKDKLNIHKKHAFYCNLYFQGEPFLHPEIYEMIKMTNNTGLYTVISTNGHFLNKTNCLKIIESGLDRLIISLDGIDANTYNHYRINGVFDKVVEGIRIMAKSKKKVGKNNPLLVVQMLVNKTNENQTEATKKFVKQLGADILEFKSMQIYSETGKEEFLPSSGKYNRYQNRQDQSLELKNNHGACFRLWSHAVYTSDGIMVPCCYDKKPEYGVNGKEEYSGNNLWKSKSMQAFRCRQLKKASRPEICYNCKQ
ncbi:MAG: radical SAM protein [Bacteroidetes bacterium]|nr:MAG: radical SAM protein [Bacteroidota bacterium]